MIVVALWMALVPASATRRGVNLWVEPQNFHSSVPEQSFADAVDGKQNMILSTYQQRLSNLGYTGNSFLSEPAGASLPAASAASAFDPDHLDFQIKTAFRAGDPLSLEQTKDSQTMNDAEKVIEDKPEYTGTTGLSQLGEETDFYNSLTGQGNQTQIPAAAEEPHQNPFWQPTARPYTSLRQQFASAVNVWDKYQHFLRGSAPQEASPQAVLPGPLELVPSQPVFHPSFVPSQADGPPKKDESVNVDTLLAVAAESKTNAFVEQESQALEKSFQSTPRKSMQSAGSLFDDLPASASLHEPWRDGGELTAAEAQRWRAMTQLTHLERDRTRDEPFSSGFPAHDDVPAALLDAEDTRPVPPRPQLWIPPDEVLSHDDDPQAIVDAPAVPPSRPMSIAARLWAPPSQAADEIAKAHGQTEESSPRTMTDLWAQQVAGKFFNARLD